MHQRLLEIPGIDVTLYGFGVMMVCGFLAALWLARRLADRTGLDQEIMTNAALYGLLVGTLGARIFFVVHHFDQFRDDLAGTVAVWRGGLEFVGGVIPALGVLLLYLHRRRLPVRRYLDIMAVGLMMGLAFGRIGCLLNGCCFGKPTDLPWGIRFPYRSYAYISQVNSDPQRNRPAPYLALPQSEYFDFSTKDGQWYPKPLSELRQLQQHEVTQGRYRCLPVHPTQAYASICAFVLCAFLWLCWRQSVQRAGRPDGSRWFQRPGVTVAAGLILYGIGRFALETVRDDNPYELGTLTVSQITGILMVISGLILLAILPLLKPEAASGCNETQ